MGQGALSKPAVQWWLSPNSSITELPADLITTDPSGTRAKIKKIKSDVRGSVLCSLRNTARAYVHRTIHPKPNQ